jgi:hypothetical protein
MDIDAIPAQEPMEQGFLYQFFVSASALHREIPIFVSGII